MVEALEKFFGKSGRVLVEDGEFNDVQGEFHHYDYSQRITNNGCYNIIGNTIHNVANIRPQVIYHDKRGSRSMHHGRFATGPGATVAASASSPYHNPQSQVPIRNNPSYNPLSPQNPGQYFGARSGDICQMSAVQVALMNNQMAHMMQKLDSEFEGDNEEQDTEMHNDDTSEDEVSTTTRSQSIATGFNRLTIEERSSSSSRSAFIHRSSSTTIKADKSPKHVIIQGDYTEVDNNFYQSDFDSHKVKNNIIGNSFGEGKQGNIGVWRMLVQSTRRKLKQAHVPRKR
jgi:hypothetical protein